MGVGVGLLASDHFRVKGLKSKERKKGEWDSGIEERSGKTSGANWVNEELVRRKSDGRRKKKLEPCSAGYPAGILHQGGSLGGQL